MSNAPRKFASTIEKVRDTVVDELGEWIYVQYANDTQPYSDHAYIVVHAEDGYYPARVSILELLNFPKEVGIKVAYQVESERFNRELERKIADEN